MATIHLEWRNDRHDCETCGLSYAEGAVVNIDGVEIDMAPSAACFDGTDNPVPEVLHRLLEHLGHTVSYKPVFRETDGDEVYGESMLLDGKPVPELEAEGANQGAVARLLERLGHEVTQDWVETGHDSFDDE